MKRSYEHLFLMNQGFDQVPRSLTALAKYPALRPDEIAQLADETRSAINSHLLDLMAAIEITRAGRLSSQRAARNRKQEQELNKAARRTRKKKE